MLFHLDLQKGQMTYGKSAINQSLNLNVTFLIIGALNFFSTTDPSQGWDGKHNGKLVPAGVYYYVIKAHGADGKNYSLSGDINIINHKKGSNRNTSYE